MQLLGQIVVQNIGHGEKLEADVLTVEEVNLELEDEGVEVL